MPRVWAAKSIRDAAAVRAIAFGFVLMECRV
jgi:hypothetical protein